MLDMLIKYRRELHQIPEIDDDVPETQAYLLKALADCGGKVFTPTKGSVCVYFDAGKPDTVAFRSDMDGLPVTEQSGLEFQSRHTGKMHACGHDGHMAMLLGLARKVPQHLDKLPHNVLLIFQPAEESWGGAEPICKAGVLRDYKVKHIFGTHLWPGIPLGRVATKPGPLMSKSSNVDVTITGKSAHIGKAWEGKDALLAGVEFINRVAVATANELPEGEMRLLRFGSFQSGTVHNVISNHTHLSGSLRTFSEETFDFLHRRMEEIAAELAAETGCTFEIVLEAGYPPTINDPALYEKAAACLGEGFLLPVEPQMPTEDFAFYQKEVPGVLFFLGIEDAPPLHAETFDFDESVLAAGLAMNEKLLYLE